MARLVAATAAHALKVDSSGVVIGGRMTTNPSTPGFRVERFMTMVLLDLHVAYWWSVEPRRSQHGGMSRTIEH